MKEKNLFSTRMLTQSGILISLVFLFTYTFKIPSPGLGYKHIGDSFIMLTAVLLPAPISALVSGLGSALSDAVGGYFLFLPGTFFIKALEAFWVRLIFVTLLKLLSLSINPSLNVDSGKSSVIWKPLLCFLIAILPAGIWMAGAYYAYEYFVMSPSIALVAFPGNLAQSLVSWIFALFLFLPIWKMKQKKLL